MKQFIMSLFLTLSLSAFGEVDCKKEIKELECDKGDMMCLGKALFKVSSECQGELQKLTMETLSNDPCLSGIQKCGPKPSEECINALPVDCKKRVKKRERVTKKIQKECDFTELNKKCFAEVDPKNPMANISKQVECFEKEKSKLSPKCQSLMKELGTP